MENDGMIATQDYAKLKNQQHRNLAVLNILRGQKSKNINPFSKLLQGLAK